MEETKQYIGRVLVRNRDHNTLPAVIHAGGMWSSYLWQVIHRQYLMGSYGFRGKDYAREEVTVATINTRGDISPFQDSVARLKVPRFIVFGVGVKATKEQFFEQRWQARLLADGLKRVPTKYTLYVDAHDAIILRSPAWILRTFKSAFDCKLLFGSSEDSFPQNKGYEEFEEGRIGADRTRFKYLCAGAWIGETEYAQRYFEAALGLSEIEGMQAGSQAVTRAAFPSFADETDLDYRCQIFQNLIGMTEGDLDLMWVDQEIRIAEN